MLESSLLTCDRLCKKNQFLKVILGMVAAMMASNPIASAQIVPDTTLGGERSHLTPNIQIGGESADRIDGGAIRGNNLFHSFSEFNVGEGQRVFFANPNGIRTIVSRVTGNTPSQINGTLGVDGEANFFLLNPNGVILGPHARLDMSGAFVGTTAHAIRFGRQGVFSSTDPNPPSLLTVNPSALLFNRISHGAITNHSRSLIATDTPHFPRSLLLLGYSPFIKGREN